MAFTENLNTEGGINEILHEYNMILVRVVNSFSVVVVDVELVSSIVSRRVLLKSKENLILSNDKPLLVGVVIVVSVSLFLLKTIPSGTTIAMMIKRAMTTPRMIHRLFR